MLSAEVAKLSRKTQSGVRLDGIHRAGMFMKRMKTDTSGWVEYTKVIEE